MNIFRKLFSYLRGARQELKKINWPTSKEVFQKTVVVILFSAVITAALGGFDVLFNRAVLALIASQSSSGPAFNIEDFSPEDFGTQEPIQIEVGDAEGLSPAVEEVTLEEVEAEE